MIFGVEVGDASGDRISETVRVDEPVEARPAEIEGDEGEGGDLRLRELYERGGKENAIGERSGYVNRGR